MRHVCVCVYLPVVCLGNSHFERLNHTQKLADPGQNSVALRAFIHTLTRTDHFRGS